MYTADLRIFIINLIDSKIFTINLKTVTADLKIVMTSSETVTVDLNIFIVGLRKFIADLEIVMKNIYNRFENSYEESL